uniref:Pancreatic trypsin inhibitor n=1 Tax=Rhipicephalus zambeziensis TaxID=60191 RepID=A0A224YBU4_9ACAR
MKSTAVLFVFVARVCRIYGASQITPSYCLKPKAAGKTCGGGPFTSWYFDSESRKCKAFTFGGCNGNLNRFSSEAQCQRWCLRGVPEKPVCSLAAEKGDGTGAIFAWSYDAKQDQCQVFLYSGFGGNSNNFQSCHQCMNRCSGNKNARYICNVLNYQLMIYYYTRLPFGIGWPIWKI